MYIGALAGGNGGIVINCHADGQVTSIIPESDVGGLIGGNSGVVLNSTADVAVTGHAETVSGGLIGRNSGIDGAPAIVQNGYSSGSVLGGSAVGGLIGETDGGKISNSYSTASVTGNDGAAVGGLIGVFAPVDSTKPALNASYATGVVSVGAIIGGLIGQDMVGSGITNSY